jgi:hypothetical protein
MWFKSKSKKERELQLKKEEKEQELQELQGELIELKGKYAYEINSYCMIDNWIFILLGFTIENNEIKVVLKDKDTVVGYTKLIDIYWFRINDRRDFKQARFQFIKFKDDLKKVGLKLEKL